MRVSKYLSEIKAPEYLPGPFGVRLKYELKQEFLDRKRNFWVPVLSSSLAFGFAFMSFLIVKPETAIKLHQMAFNDNRQMDYLLMHNQNENLEDYNSKLKPVSTESPFSMMEDDKSYIIHKIKDNDNRTIIYVSEVKKSVQPKVLY